MELTAKFAAGAVALAAAGALVAAPLVSGLTAATESPDVALTADGKGFLSGLYGLTDNPDVTKALGEIKGGLDQVDLGHFWGGTIDDGTFQPGDVTLGDLAASQYYTLVPSGFLADDHSALVGSDGGAVPSGSGTWVSNLLDSMGQLSNTSVLANLNDVAGLLPNGVNFLFDQLAVDAINLTHALDPADAAQLLPNVVNPDTLFGTLDPALFGNLADDSSFLGGLGATVVDVFGIL